MILNLTKSYQFESLMYGLLSNPNLSEAITKIAVDFIRGFEEFCIEIYGVTDINIIHQIVQQEWRKTHYSLISDVK